MASPMKSKNIILKAGLLSCATALLAVLCAWQPIDFLQTLQQNYDRYKEKYPSVKINLIFQQPIFSPGDTAFFRAWYLNEELMPVAGNHMITLDLVGENGNTVQRLRFKVQQGKGYNQLVLGSELTPGEYRLFAYTDYMKNFGTSWYYQKRIQVISNKQLNRVNHTEEPLQFFPEGGKLVEGIINNIAVLGPHAAELSIRNRQNATIITVSLDSAGLGIFSIAPKPGQIFYTEWPSGGKSLNLPEAIREGIAVHVTSGERCVVNLAIPADSKWTGQPTYAIITSRGNIIAKKIARLSAEQPFEWDLEKNKFQDALHQLFVFDAEGNILAQRVFVPAVMKNTAVRMQLPAEVKQRENISGSISVTDAAGEPLESDICISVIQERLFKGQTGWSDFYLSDLPAAAAWAERTRSSRLNDFLVTQQWNRIAWHNVIADKLPELTYPFHSQAKINGTIAAVSNGSPPPDSTVLISYLQKNNMGFEAYANNGKFEVPFVFDFWGEDQIFCTLQSRSRNIDDRYVITLLSDSINLRDTWSTTESSLTSAYGEYALSKRLVSKSYSFFGNAQKQVTREQRALGLVKDREGNTNSSLEDELLGSDYAINVADYVVFPTMEDLLREVIPFLQARKRGSQKVVRLSFRYEQTTKTFADDPVYVIDGVMSRNTPYFLSLKPESLVSIRLINNPNKLAQLSRLGENGIVLVESKKGDLYKGLGNRNLFPVVGLSKPAAFNTLRYSASNLASRIPDLRPGLYWNPGMETDKAGHVNLNFFSSDDTGKMKILIQGLTRDGRPFAAEHEFTVSFNDSQK